MQEPWYIQLLGGLVATYTSREVRRYQTRKTGSLLAYLAYHLPTAPSRDLLLDLIWPEQDLDSARACLCTALTSLRKQLEPPGIPSGSVLLANRIDVRLNPEAVRTDLQEFQRFAQATALPHKSEGRQNQLEQAFALYQGPLLPGCYEDWVTDEREHLETLFLRVAGELIHETEVPTERCRLESALGYAQRTVRLLPDSEEMHGHVLRLYRMLGRNHEAVRHYQTFSRKWKEEWGRQPSEAIRRLVADLPSPPPGASGETDSPRGRGRPRKATPSLPDIVRETPAAGDYLSTTRERADDRPSHGTSSPGLALPLVFTRFFGREEECSYLQTLLAPPRQVREPGDAPGSARPRLVTLIGLGGSGKTRLAVEVALALSSVYRENITFVELAGVSGDLEMAAAILRSLGCSQTGEDFIGQIITALNSKETTCPTLLILDNVEHLLEECVPLVRKLLGAVPALTLLLTSRTPLDLPDERIFPVEPLPVPSHAGTPERLVEFACVQMFVDRAQAARPDFQLTAGNAAVIVDICKKLEGIPLAIELAAARSFSLSPRQMLSELNSSRFRFLVRRHRGGAERHCALFAAIEWSYGLLDPATRLCFCVLSVFRGGWTLEGARAICKDILPADSDPTSEDVLSHLEILLKRSLITARESNGAMRYFMLESLREFAAEKAVPVRKATAYENLTRYMLTLAETWGPALHSSDVSEAIACLEPELENLRNVLALTSGSDTDAAITPDPQAALRLFAAAWRLWFLRGMVVEGEELMAVLFKASGAAPPLEAACGLWGRLWMGRAVFAYFQAHFEEVEQYAWEGVRYSQQAADISNEADALNLLAVVLGEQKSVVTARSLLAKSIQLRRQSGNHWALASSLNNLAMLEQRAGDLDGAALHYRESLTLYRRLGDRVHQATVLSNLGVIADARGDYAAARSAYEEGLVLARDSGNLRDIATLLYNLGEAMFRDCNHPDAVYYILESIRLRVESNHTAKLVFPLTTLANIAAAQGDFLRAVRLYGAADNVRQTLKTPLFPMDLAAWEQDRVPLHERLSEEEFQIAWNLGAKMELDEILSYAREAAAVKSHSASASIAFPPIPEKPRSESLSKSH